MHCAIASGLSLLTTFTLICEPKGCLQVIFAVNAPSEVGDTVDKKNVINSYEAEIVQEIFSKFANGHTGKSIADNLIARGIRTKRGHYIDDKKVYKIIANTKYVGKVQHGDTVYTNIYPAIIDEATAEVNVVKIKYKQKDNRYTNFFKNYKFFYNKISELSDSQLNNIAKSITDNCEVIEIKSWQVEQAITISSNFRNVFATIWHNMFYIILITQLKLSI